MLKLQHVWFGTNVRQDNTSSVFLIKGTANHKGAQISIHVKWLYLHAVLTKLYKAKNKSCQKKVKILKDVKLVSALDPFTDRVVGGNSSIVKIKQFMHIQCCRIRAFVSGWDTSQRKNLLRSAIRNAAIRHDPVKSYQ